MNVSPAKENILKKIRKALSQSTPLPFPGSEGSNTVFAHSGQELAIEFAEQFSRLLGKFVYCADNAELIEQLAAIVTHEKWSKLYCNDSAIKQMLPAELFERMYTDDLAGCDAALTGCECLVARTGSMALSARQESGRTVSVYAPIHICIAYSSQLVYDVKDALQLMKDKYGANLPSLMTFATGPSRTADIEKTLVVGVHGPKEVYVFLVEDETV
jgi:L-lactate dehydrogenase complex protein LldG